MPMDLGGGGKYALGSIIYKREFTINDVAYAIDNGCPTKEDVLSNIAHRGEADLVRTEKQYQP